MAPADRDRLAALLERFVGQLGVEDGAAPMLFEDNAPARPAAQPAARRGRTSDRPARTGADPAELQRPHGGRQRKKLHART